MAHRSIHFLAVVLTVTMAACSASSIVSSVPSAPSVPSAAFSPDETGFFPMAASNAAYQACPVRPNHPEEWRCMAWVRRDLRPFMKEPKGIPAGVGYGPSALAAAYGFDPKQGEGQTVAVVDAYRYAEVSYDLSQYRAAAGLPPCTTANKCLRILNQNGTKLPLPILAPSYAFGWLVEQALDLDAVSAVCPRCKIILIETNSAAGADLLAGATTAARLSKIVSMSFGAPENLVGKFSIFPKSGHALVASAGDSGGGIHGGGAIAPCVWSNVICVGGTMLTHVGNKWTSVVWNDEQVTTCGGPCGATGSGCSLIVPKPSWQHDAGCTMRSEADISADASVRTPFAVYNSIFPGTKAHPDMHWAGIGGTSLSTPIIAAMIALAGNPTSLHGAKEIWDRHDELTSVHKGTNVYEPVTGACASSVHYICIAGEGYDGPAGWGTPHDLSDL